MSHVLISFLMLLAFGFASFSLFFLAITGPQESFSKEILVYAAQAAGLMIFCLLALSAMLVVSFYF